MKYYRPQLEVEAMKFLDEDIFLVEFPDGTQRKIGGLEFARDFRKMNGQDPVKIRKKPERKKINYQSSAQAPDLGQRTELISQSTVSHTPEGLTIVETPKGRLVAGKEAMEKAFGHVDPAQEYDHQ